MMATTNQFSQPPSAFNGYQNSSPLETLVRRTSSRRGPPKPVNVPVTDTLNQNFTYPERQQASSSTPPRQHLGPQYHQNAHHNLSPSSPLLHSHFARGSTATASSGGNESYLDFSSNPNDDYYDADSIYSTDTMTSPALRDSWATTRPHPDSYIAERSLRNDYQPEPTSPVPMVVVSSPFSDTSDPTTPQSRSTAVGKAPVVKPLTSNFSRPVRPLVSDEHLERRKLIVLQRNARQEQTLPPVSPTPSSYSSSTSSYSPPPQAESHSIPTQQGYPQLSRSASSTSTLRTPASDPYLSTTRTDTVQLPRKPPSLRAGSPTSLYSEYSYYQMDSATPSPSNTQFPKDIRGQTPTPQPKVTFQHSAMSRTPSPAPSATATSTPEHFLQLGITHHEANRLTDSAACFEKSAVLNGGCGVGMLMWGLTLRHGWGCRKDEKTGFSWLRKAAELAVTDLERGKGDLKESVRGELVLAIYEVGQCFFHGWGVAKDQKMGVSYYTTAARLGDPDAQNDLAFCLANGKGCKKDRKEAAGWYRKAVAQGQSDIGLAWIYKEKFQ